VFQSDDDDDHHRKGLTLEKLKRIMKSRRKESLDQTINSLIETFEDVPESMFGVDRQREFRLTNREHEELQRDRSRK
jgi:hypothetical protein